MKLILLWQSDEYLIELNKIFINTLYVTIISYYLSGIIKLMLIKCDLLHLEIVSYFKNEKHRSESYNNGDINLFEHVVHQVHYNQSINHHTNVTTTCS